MPVTKSAAKAARQNLKHYKRNLVLKRRYKNDIKALVAAIAAGKQDAITKATSLAQSSIDKAVKNGIMHPNKAARTKFQLSKLTAVKTIAKPAAKSTAKASVKKTPKRPAAKPSTSKK